MPSEKPEVKTPGGLAFDVQIAEASAKKRPLSPPSNKTTSASLTLDVIQHKLKDAEERRKSLEITRREAREKHNKEELLEKQRKAKELEEKFQETSKEAYQKKMTKAEELLLQEEENRRQKIQQQKEQQQKVLQRKKEIGANGDSNPSEEAKE